MFDEPEFDPEIEDEPFFCCRCRTTDDSELLETFGRGGPLLSVSVISRVGPTRMLRLCDSCGAALLDFLCRTAGPRGSSEGVAAPIPDSLINPGAN
ncbi:MAG: hypothetical protein ABS79_00585 [Planctomycetes bacterium SCN 63-9]|nr:MAG: hypothetical protein ABS79_00585 [Planctomycetes bacterium SCN 63-9]